MAEPPLTGLKVLDLSRLLPGGYATLLLADLGADVLKVEQPGVGDGVRGFPPFGADGGSGAHQALNRGKRSVTLDLRAAQGRDVLVELSAASDVLVESFRPGVMQRLGLGYDTLRRTNPG
jgi:alpha-methylacyl-CoA racemase